MQWVRVSWVGAASTFSSVAWACPRCATSDAVWREVAASGGSPLGILMLAFAVVGALIVGTAQLLVRGYRLLLGGGLLLGAGLGAFIDGILLHQVLQWHAMLSNRLPPTELVASKVNMFWDGVFHLLAWFATLAALTLVFRELPRAEARVRSRALPGAMLAGWGYFNVVEGLIDHHVFALHHVHPGADELAWDVGFLGLGALLIAAGAGLARPAWSRPS